VDSGGRENRGRVLPGPARGHRGDRPGRGGRPLRTAPAHTIDGCNNWLLIEADQAESLPYRGAASALAQLVNGAHPGLGPFRLELTRFARSMPSLHQLMPEYACLHQDGDLAKTTGITLPELDTAMVTDAMCFATTKESAA